MFIRKTILAATAVASLATAALAPTSASAWGHWGGHWGGGHWGHWGGGHWGHWGGGHWGHWGGWGHWAHWGHGCGWGGYCGPHGWGPRYPIVTGGGYYGGGYSGGGTYGGAPAYALRTGTDAAPAPGPGCLTKSYLQDGSVVFTDTCTKESAIAPSDDTQHPQAGPQGGPQGGPRTR